MRIMTHRVNEIGVDVMMWQQPDIRYPALIESLDTHEAYQESGLMVMVHGPANK